MSEQQACRLVRTFRSTVRYSSRCAASATSETTETTLTLTERLKQIGQKHPRFGYRRAHALVGREGIACNPKRVYRLWRREGLAVRPRRSKRKLPALVAKQERPQAATCPNAVWCVDFVQDHVHTLVNQTMTGRKVRFLTVTDEFPRESLAIHLGWSIKAQDVAKTLEQVICERVIAPAFCAATTAPSLRKRKRIHCLGAPWLPAPRQRQDRLHRQGQSVAERLCREFPLTPS